MPRKLFYALAALIFFAAIFFRHVDLSTHFVTYDDMAPIPLLLSIKAYENHRFYEPAFFFSTYNTNAPLQFLFTTQLLSPEMGYRDLVYRARLPSFLAAIFTVILFFFFLSYFFSEIKKTKPLLFQSLVLLGTSMIAFSWMHVIYSKFSCTYAITPFFFLLMLYRLSMMAREKKNSLKELCLTLGLLMMACFASYQNVLFIPGFVIAVIWLAFRPLSTKAERKKMAGQFVLLGATFGVYFYLFWKKFLAPYNTGPLAGERGPSDLFMLYLKNYEGLGAKLVRLAEYIPVNFGRILQSNLSYTEDGTNLSFVLTGFFYVFLLLGVFSWIQKRGDPLRKSLLIFSTVSIAVWASFLLRDRMTMSPTRHQMVLIPIMILLVIEGLFFLLQMLRQKLSLGLQALPLVFAIVLTTSFALSFPEMTKRRVDPLQEPELIKLFQEHDVQMVFQAPNMLNLAFMQDLIKQFPVVTGIWLNIKQKRPQYEAKTLAYISPGAAELSPEGFNDFVKRFNEVSEGHIWKASLADYEVVYSRKYEGVMMDYTRYSLFQNSSTNFYILKQKPTSKAFIQPAAGQ
ncbi:MAG: hypothetical protein AB7F59_08850 [Bdellovibrionales bacterium]